MVFNSDTYYANKYRRLAWQALAEARDIKRRAAEGTAYSWEPGRIPLKVREARTSMHVSLSFRVLGAMKNRARNIRSPRLTELRKVRTS